MDAFRIKANGELRGLTDTKLRGTIDVDPGQQDKLLTESFFGFWVTPELLPGRVLRVMDDAFSITVLAFRSS